MLMRSLSGAKFARRIAAVVLCLGSMAGVMRLTVRSTFSSAVRTEDRNHDAQPDVWEANSGDDDSVVAIDTNFDGRPDERLRYRNGDLVSLETDSDFDNRVDIVEEFDPITHEVVRSLIDIDEDFDDDDLIPLADPFIGDITVRSSRPWRPAQRDSLLSTSGGLPLPAMAISGAHSSVSVGEPAPHSCLRLAVAPPSPRGPPIYSPSPAAFL